MALSFSNIRIIMPRLSAIPGMRPMFKLLGIGADLTRVQCQGESLVVGVVVDDSKGWERGC